MFSPEGYVPLSEISSACWTVAEDRFPSPNPWDFEVDIRAKVYAELLFSRFVAANLNQMWVFQFPSLILRVWPKVFFRLRRYEGPCPVEKEEAQEVFDHLEKGPHLFLTRAMRINANVAREEVEVWGLHEDVEIVKPLQGATVCWQPGNWPVDPEREVWPFRDEIYYQGHPYLPVDAHALTEKEGLKVAYDAYLRVCPVGKDASGLTWREVEKQTGWSRRQIARALKVHGGRESGQASGQDVGS